MLATTQEWTVSAGLVDVVIALSVLFVAVIGLRGRPKSWTWFGAALFGVGLVHGLGLATRLLELGVSDNDLVWRVLLFNVGVELGQAAAVLAFVGAGMLLARVWASRERGRRPAYGVIATAGAVGAAILSLPSDDAGSKPETVGGACSNAQAQPPTANDAGHPPRRFYGPDEQSPAAAFTHVRGDGYIVVTYRPDLGAGDLAALRQHIATGPNVVYAGPDPAQTVPVIATTAFTQLTCTQLDVPALGTFRDGWLKQMGGSIG